MPSRFTAALPSAGALVLTLLLTACAPRQPVVVTQTAAPDPVVTAALTAAQDAVAQVVSAQAAADAATSTVLAAFPALEGVAGALADRARVQEGLAGWDAAVAEWQQAGANHPAAYARYDELEAALTKARTALQALADDPRTAPLTSRELATIEALAGYAAAARHVTDVATMNRAVYDQLVADAAPVIQRIRDGWFRSDDEAAAAYHVAADATLQQIAAAQQALAAAEAERVAAASVVLDVQGES